MSTELAHYEGLVFKTAQMYTPFLDDDEDDVRQQLRIKVWQALQSFDPAKARQTREKYVFMCVRNGVKDLLKRRRRDEGFIEDEAPEDAASRARFEARHLSVDESAVVEAIIEGKVILPNTLSALEVRVVVLLLRDFNQTEIALQLGTTRQKVREAHRSVKVKMADWGQDEEPAHQRSPRRLAAAA